MILEIGKNLYIVNGHLVCCQSIDGMSSDDLISFLYSVADALSNRCFVFIDDGSKVTGYTSLLNDLVDKSKYACVSRCGYNFYYNPAIRDVVDGKLDVQMRHLCSLLFSSVCFVDGSSYEFKSMDNCSELLSSGVILRST